MQRTALFDSAGFVLALGGFVAVIGGIGVGIGVAQAAPTEADLWQNPWFVGGVVVIAAGVLIVLWAIVLFLAHGHAASHLSEQTSRAQSGKKGAAKVAPYRLAVDTLVTWIYRRREWSGLSTDGKYREPAPKNVGNDLYKVLGLPDSYEPVDNIAPEPGFDGPTTAASAGLASGKGAALDASIKITDSVAHRVIPGPGSPTLHQMGYQTEGRRHFAYGQFGNRPKAVRFSKPEDRLLRSADLPFEMPCGSGQIVVEKFYADGLVIDEIGTVGDPIAFVAYFDD